MKNLFNSELEAFANYSCKNTGDDSFQIEKTINAPEAGAQTKTFVFTARSTGWKELKGPTQLQPAMLFSLQDAAAIVARLKAINREQPPIVTYSFRSAQS